jgi:acid phosphatase family membrane protein YuiD
MVKGDVSEKKLKEVLGHSPLQVFAGSFLGVLIGIMYMYRYSGGYGCLA